MRWAQFSGYPVVVRSPLDTATCRDRLLDEFTDRAGRWQHGRTDNTLIGWPTRSGFEIMLASQYLRSLPGSRRTNAVRVCSVRLRADARGGTSITGVYGYRDADSVLLGIIFGCLIGGLVCSAFVVLGLVALLGQHDGKLALFFLLVGLVPPIVGIAILREQSDDSFPAERDRIERALCRLLDATPISPPV